MKDDSSKLMYNLIPTSAIEGLAEVLTMGAKKYTPDGWRTVPDAVNRYYSALYRHLIAWRNGEMIDPESGLHHMKHVMINVAFLLELTNEDTVSNMFDAAVRSIDNGPTVREESAEERSKRVCLKTCLDGKCTCGR